MIFRPDLDSQSELPLYRQLHAYFANLIAVGRLEQGARIPATRELAGQLGLNRTTVSAAYSLLESEGLISGQVGRGSFVTGTGSDPGTEPSGGISFANSRPSERLFPLDAFRASCRAVMERRDFAAVLQLGSSTGFEPLRRYLLEEARREGVLGPQDDVMIASGCQQALDLLCRVLVQAGDRVVVEDPVYPGLKDIFAQAGAHLVGAPVNQHGVDPDRLRALLLTERPRVLVLTSNFQNPTGATLPQATREAIVRAAADTGTVVIENDPYGDLRYTGQPVASIKSHATEGVVLLRSFSKIAFPGLRVGWVVASSTLIGRLAEAKQLCDLHTDQFSQAALLEFAVSGSLAAHRETVIAAGRARLEAVLEACARHLPPNSHFTRPEGGMNLWVRLPDGLDAAALLADAQRAGVSYLPGRHFAVSRTETNGLRLSFAGLTPREIHTGVGILGEVFAAGWERSRATRRLEPTPALV